ncbi:MAG: hypothetical protein HZB26_02230 [Candidatus Hydrogenedentes bacterium]|nr:hypothetical protein [Candidatus Hydrogenedentota bacterium]
MKDPKRGAALVIAIAIMTVLLLIALLFFTLSRAELRTATNVTNTYRTDLIANGALAMAMATLNHDLAIHATYTSTDHEWKTRYNNGWAAGKQWAWKSYDLATGKPLPVALGGVPIPLIDSIGPDTNRGVPEVDLTDPNMPAAYDDPSKPLFLTSGTADMMWIPRAQANAANAANFTGPFVTTTDLGVSSLASLMGITAGQLTKDYNGRLLDFAGPLLPSEQLHFINDVDNNDDGLRDSAWIPMGADKDLESDGVDNDLDDNFDNLDAFGKTQVEFGYFVYFDSDLNRLMLTAPITYPHRARPLTNITVRVSGQFLAEHPGVSPSLDPRPGSPDVDAIDNDFNQIINDREEYMYRYRPAINSNGVRAAQNPLNPTPAEIEMVWVDNRADDNITADAFDAGVIQDVLRRRGHPIAQLSTQNADGTWTVFTSSGEPACDLVGRAAILITDESGKVNLNATGGRTYRDAWNRTNANTDPIVQRAQNQGATTWEFDTRVLPQIDLARSDHLWSLLTGDWEGKGFAINPATTAVGSQLIQTGGALEEDRGFPGYGFVDNTGNALWLALSGIDWDGNGFFYDGIFRYNYSGVTGATPIVGLLETINGPSQFRQFRPYRNFVAEGIVPVNAVLDALDNNSNGAVNEIGEGGDRALKTTEQIKNAAAIADGTFDDLHNLITAHSTDKNERHQAMDALGFPLSNPRNHVVTGLKLDYSYAQPDEIAKNLVVDWGYPDMVNELARGTGITDPLELQEAQNYLNQIAGGAPVPVVGQVDLTNFFRYALGLKREDMSLLAPQGLFRWNAGANAITALPADANLRAAQLAVNIKDSRDGDFARSELTSSVADDLWWDDVQLTLRNSGLFTGTPTTRPISYTQAGVESIRINELMIRPVRRIEAEMNTAPSNVQLNPNQYIMKGTGNANLEDFINYGNYTDAAGRPLTFRSFIGDTRHPDANHQPSDWVLDPASTPYLGDRAYVTTAASTLPLTDGTPSLEENAIQFLFGPSIGLPPGRYYLTVNTAAGFDAGGNPKATALTSGDLRFAIKYVRFAGATQFGPNNTTVPRLKSVGATDILTDIIAQYGAAGPAVPWKNTAVIGLQDMAAGNPGLVSGVTPGSNNATGWVFFPSDLTANAAPVMPGYNQDDGYTVEIPPAGSNIFLCVAVQMTKTPTATDPNPVLSVNFFDFSQILDHQYIELVNTDKSNDPNNAVDLAGWQVQIGVPNMRRLDGNIASPTLVTIPEGTLIAPGGSILLAMDKFDGFQDPSYFDPAFPFPYSPLPTDDLMKISGIGLARGTIPTDPVAAGQFYLNVTEPPNPNPIFTASLGLQQSDVSVFDRGNTYLDFVDRNGDGTLDAGNNEDAIRSTVDLIGPNTLTKAWDRIVQVNVQGDLFPAGTVAEGVGGVAKLAAAVLSGGILPNYPEHDGVDNDGDDEILNADVFVTGSPYPNHRGIDEGHWTELGTPNNPVPGSFSNVPFGYSLDFGAFGTGSPVLLPSPVDTSTVPPDWKEFIERRSYPGDCVTITLYQGSAAFDRVVDRVTYTERDVINRSIDDVVACPYTYTDGSGTTQFATLNPNYLSFWLDNTMALDFYRTLERKHPLCNGDRFGTVNRWQATDGAYDDWAPSTSRFERLVDANGNVTAGLPIDRADPANPTLALLFDHCFAGSPLRMGLTQRYIENPFVDGTAVREFVNDAAGVAYQANTAWAFSKAQVRNRNYVSSGDLLTLPHYSAVHTMKGPSPTGGPAANYLYDDTHINVNVNGLIRENTDVREAILGQAFTNDIRAVTSMEVNNSLTLAAAQATVRFGVSAYQDWAATGVGLPEDWRPVYLKEIEPASDTNTSLVTVTPPPNETFRLGDSRHYLLQYDYQNALPPPGVVPIDLIARWPMNTLVRSDVQNGIQRYEGSYPRAVMFVSGNFANFAPESQHWAFPFPPDGSRGTLAVPISPAGNGAEVSFTWTGDSGLENGDYDAYVATLDDLSLLGVADATLPTDANSRNYLTPFGRDFVALANSIVTKDMHFDLELMTDKNGDRVAGIPIDASGNLVPERDVNGVAIPGRYVGSDESFGMVTGATPDTDGLIHYGPVRVDNNTLKLNLRNWSKRGQLARFSRVILTPHNRTPGRVNINTAETRQVAVGTNANNFFNALTGVPGALVVVNPVTGVNQWAWDDPTARTSVIAAPQPLLSRVQSITYQDLGGQNPAAAHKGRPEWFDGRYYRDPSDLVGWAEPGIAAYPTTLVTLAPAPPSPLPNNVPVQIADQGVWNGMRFDEMQLRFGRMANLITTRSDVFEIIVTAQSGFLSNTDTNGDGRIDYRNDFVVTAEKKVRTIYER